MPQLRQTHAHTPKKKGGEKTLTKRIKRRIRHELSVEKPTIWIGKEGVTAQLVSEISSQLKKREMIKAKILKTALKEEKAKDLATRVAAQTESTLVEVRGHTFMLYKPKKREKRSPLTFKTSKR